MTTAQESCALSPNCVRPTRLGQANLMAGLLWSKVLADALQSAATMMVVIYMLHKYSYLYSITATIKHKGSPWLQMWLTLYKFKVMSKFGRHYECNKWVNKMCDKRKEVPTWYMKTANIANHTGSSHVGGLAGITVNTRYSETCHQHRGQITSKSLTIKISTVAITGAVRTAQFRLLNITELVHTN